jgi:uncharacterized membrane protein YphA (DoxX/SURF4 family)
MATNTTAGGESETSIFGRFFAPWTDHFYLAFRLIFALLVFLHGIQEAFLLWNFPAGANPNGLGALVDLAGWVEIISAILIATGVLTRLGAGALVVTMVVAYFGVHAALSPVWPWPHLYPNPPDGGNAFVAHGGEVIILWFICAGIIGIMGSRKFGIERLILKREIL